VRLRELFFNLCAFCIHKSYSALYRYDIIRVDKGQKYRILVLILNKMLVVLDRLFSIDNLGNYEMEGGETKRVVLLASSLERKGGHSRQFVQMLTNLDKLGIEAEVILTGLDCDHLMSYDEYRDRRGIYFNNPTHFLRTSSYSFYENRHKITDYILKNKFTDMVLFNSGSDVSALMASLSLRQRCNVHYYHHNDDFFQMCDYEFHSHIDFGTHTACLGSKRCVVRLSSEQRILNKPTLEKFEILMFVSKKKFHGNEAYLLSSLDTLLEHNETYVTLCCRETDFEFFLTIINENFTSEDILNIRLLDCIDTIEDLPSKPKLLVDTYPIGGGNGLIDALSFGIPIVTFNDKNALCFDDAPLVNGCVSYKNLGAFVRELVKCDAAYARVCSLQLEAYEHYYSKAEILSQLRKLLNA
jgi:hypothetical protein